MSREFAVGYLGRRKVLVLHYLAAVALAMKLMYVETSSIVLLGKVIGRCGERQGGMRRETQVRSNDG